uniref:Ig-like domain-containing protein n=1 Tax=Scophthalmus maximus TaxID=52904 RepID=A0A8D3E298_SCOMX
SVQSLHDAYKHVTDVTQTPLLWKDKGQSATMNCSHTKDASYFQMYWFRQLPGEAMKQIVYTSTSPPHQYESGFSEDKYPAQKSDAQSGSLTVEKLQPGDSGVYFCAVSKHIDTSDSGGSFFGKGTKLTVLGNDLLSLSEPEYDVKPPVVKVLGPSSRECRNLKDNERRKTLLCVASDFYPDHVSVSWRVGGQEVSRGVATDNAALRQGENYKITSRLRVSAEDWFKPETEFECIVSFFDGTGNTNHSASIFGGKGLSRGT